jgi:hypothetical protein
MGKGRGNPARRVEQVAIELVAVWVGDTGVVVDLSATNGPDFGVDYIDGRTAVGEVTWHEDPDEAAMWDIVHKSATPQLVPLRAGLGSWGVRLHRGATLKDLGRRLSPFIDMVLASGLTWFEPARADPRSPIVVAAKRLGIEYIHRSDTGHEDTALYLFGGGGGMIPTDGEVIVDWLEEIVRSERFRDLTGKLEHVEADEKHIFIMSGSSTEFPVDERLRRVGEVLPSRSPVLPSWITHAWAMSRYKSADGIALWVRDVGWQLVSTPE